MASVWQVIYIHTHTTVGYCQNDSKYFDCRTIARSIKTLKWSSLGLGATGKRNVEWREWNKRKKKTRAKVKEFRTVFIIALGQVYYVQLRIAVIIRKCFLPCTQNGVKLIRIHTHILLRFVSCYLCAPEKLSIVHWTIANWLLYMQPLFRLFITSHFSAHHKICTTIETMMMRRRSGGLRKYECDYIDNFMQNHHQSCTDFYGTSQTA